MNKCLFSDDDDEEDHRPFFSCPDSCPATVLSAERGIPANGNAYFLFKSCSDLIATVFNKKQQIIIFISGNRDYYGLISG